MVEVSHHPISFFTLDGALRPYEGKMWRDTPPRFSSSFWQNVIYWLVQKQGSVLMGHKVPYEMDAQLSITIDTEFDFTLAKLISENYG